MKIGVKLNWFVGRADDVIKSSGYRIGPFEVENGTAEEESQPLVPWIFLKIRIVLAVLLMLAFLLLKYNAYEFHGYQTKDVIDIISDNQYYTILQDYVMINEHD